jgi:hypothetical protein
MKRYKVIYQDNEDNDLYFCQFYAASFEQANAFAYEKMASKNDDSVTFTIEEIA